MIKHSKKLLIAALLMGWYVDWLFYGKPIGISLIVFALVAVGVVVWNGRVQNLQPMRRNLWLIVPLVFFAGMAFLRANPLLTTLNVLAVISLLTYLVFYYAAGQVSGVGLVGSWLVPLRVSGNSLRMAGPLVAEHVDLQSMRTHGRKQLFPIIRGGLLASPVLLVFTFLLASADVVFADYVENAFSLEFIPDLIEWGWRILLMLMIGWLVAGAFVYMAERYTQQNDEGLLEQAFSRFPLKVGIGFIETTTVLVLVNLLFLGFVLVQFTYLFGGTANVDSVGYTYADYARRGFFELLTVAVLTLSMILGLNWLTRRENKRQIRWFNLSSSVMMGFVLVILVSAFQRMRLYEAAFGYTRLRLNVYVFMVWLGALLVWFVLSQWVRPDRFAIGGIVMAIGFLVTLNVINPDRFIAQENITRYRQMGDLDVAYLTTLSDDAIPVLVDALPMVAGDTQEVLKPQCDYFWDEGYNRYEEDCYGTITDILTESLNGRYTQLTTDTDWQKWQSFHLSRRQAFRELDVFFSN